MVFEVVRGYIQLASGLSEVTRARATEVAQGLLSLPATGVATGGQVAVQVGALAEELLAAAATNRQNLAALVRSEVDAAVTRLGLVSAEKLDESQAEVARLRAEVADLRSASKERTTAAKATAAKTAVRKTAAKDTAAKTVAKKVAAKATSTKTVAKKTANKVGAKTTAGKATATKTAARKTAAKTTAAKAPAAKTAVKSPTTSASVESRRNSSAGA
jgi:polyhydroxyalkanoate synthesis regulator phasin